MVVEHWRGIFGCFLGVGEELEGGLGSVERDFCDVVSWGLGGWLWVEHIPWIGLRFSAIKL